MAKPIRDLVGNRYGRLVVKSRSLLRDGQGRIRWVCLCDCGNKKTVTGNNLAHGGTRSCGCLLRQRAHEPRRPGARATVAAVERRVVRPVVSSLKDERYILAAFEDAGGDGIVAGYRAAVAAWKRLHPDHAPEYASARAIEVVLRSRYSGCFPC